MTPIEFVTKTWQMIQGIVEEAAPELSQLGLYPRSLFLLGKVDQLPDPAQLAEALLLPAPTVSFIVKQLEKQGFLKREVEPEDLRRYRLSLTDKGRKVAQKGRDLLEMYASKKIKRLSKTQLGEFEKLVAILGSKEEQRA